MYISGFDLTIQYTRFYSTLLEMSSRYVLSLIKFTLRLELFYNVSLALDGVVNILSRDIFLSGEIVESNMQQLFYFCLCDLAFQDEMKSTLL